MLTEILAPSRFTTFEKVPVKIFAAASGASAAVAREIANLIISKQVKKEKAVLGLATVSAPKEVCQELIRFHREEALRFKNVITFNLDQYYPIAPDALQSYRHFINENLFDQIDINKDNCFVPNAREVEMKCPDSPPK